VKPIAVLGAALLSLLPGIGIAQDVQPVFDLPTLAGGQVISSTAKNQGRPRASGRGRSATRAKICSQRPSLRRQYGPSNPQMLELDRLCRRDGYGG
jgi:hypothetical protein